MEIFTANQWGLLHGALETNVLMSHPTAVAKTWNPALIDTRGHSDRRFSIFQFYVLGDQQTRSRGPTLTSCDSIVLIQTFTFWWPSVYEGVDGDSHIQAGNKAGMDWESSKTQLVTCGCCMWVTNHYFLSLSAHQPFSVWYGTRHLHAAILSPSVIPWISLH